METFKKVKETFGLYPHLFEKNFPAPVDNFLENQFKNDKILKPLRLN
jgi:hypothetical protein